MTRKTNNNWCWRSHAAAANEAKRTQTMNTQIANPARPALLATALLLLVARLAPAQPSDDWFTVDGGGGTSGGGQFTLSGTAGQPDAGVMTGGGYTLHGGFWGLVAAFPPRLTISGAGGSVTICWPWPSSGYVLVQSDSLVNPNWTPVIPQPTQTDPITWCLTLQVGPTPKYYRLKKSVS
jgi:hypothetical protein